MSRPALVWRDETGGFWGGHAGDDGPVEYRIRRDQFADELVKFVVFRVGLLRDRPIATVDKLRVAKQMARIDWQGGDHG